jgi:hypothetical protein
VPAVWHWHWHFVPPAAQGPGPAMYRTTSSKGRVGPADRNPVFRGTMVRHVGSESQAVRPAARPFKAFKARARRTVATVPLAVRRSSTVTEPGPDAAWPAARTQAHPPRDSVRLEPGQGNGLLT